MKSLPIRAAVLLVAALPALAAERTDKVTFYRHIAPIVYRHCAPCHRPGESGPFSLLTYDDAKRHASQIADVTKRRFMPPWLPEAGHGEFLEERRLSDTQIEQIQRWVEQGAPAGSPADAPPRPKFPSEWQLGQPDLVLHVAKPYRLPAGGSEVFWNFIIPVPVTTERWVKAIEILPGNPKVIHHASIILDRSRSARRHEASPGSGFPGMDLTVEETSFDPDGTFLAWKPGSVPTQEPDGMAWRATPGMDLVFNVHMRPSGKPELINPQIGFYFADKPPTKFPLLIELQRDGSIDIPPGERDYVVKDDFRCPIDVNILAIYPHAHYLGKLLEGFATLPDGTRKWLIRIPDWDLNWQGVYHFKEPVALPAGSTISMRFHYDNSADNVRNPNNPPKRVKGGSQANDEMGNLWLQVLPEHEGDQRAMLEEAVARQRLEHEPADFSANFILGDLLLSRGEALQALSYFEAAWKTEPRNAVAATELGVALASASRLPEALQQFKRALQIDPQFTEARFDLASVEAEAGQWETAAADFGRVLAERPGETRARQHLGEVLFLWGDQFAKTGDFEHAADQYRAALKYRAGDPELHMSLGVALAQLRRLAEARREFEDALRLDAHFQPARQALASLPATGAKP
jgi:tetratricopeptide (TPR) repeat protein/mono/diheme cytochrome c family protein